MQARLMDLVLCRTLLICLLLCGAATLGLLWPASADTFFLFLSRAAVMASYTTLYVYTPEVPNLSDPTKQKQA